MNKDSQYTRISVNRSDLFEVCKLGFIAQRIGTLWCEGWMLTERLTKLAAPYQVI